MTDEEYKEATNEAARNLFAEIGYREFLSSKCKRTDNRRDNNIFDGIRTESDNKTKGNKRQKGN